MVGDGKYGKILNLDLLGVGFKDSTLYKKLTNRVYFVRVPKLAVTADDGFVMFDKINGKHYKQNLHTMVTRGLTLLNIMEIYEKGYSIFAISKNDIKTLIDHINEYLAEFPRLKNMPNIAGYDVDLLNRLERFGREILENQNSYLSSLEIKYEDKLNELGMFNLNGPSKYKNVNISEATPDFNQQYSEDNDKDEHIVLYNRFSRRK